MPISKYACIISILRKRSLLHFKVNYRFITCSESEGGSKYLSLFLILGKELDGDPFLLDELLWRRRFWEDFAYNLFLLRQFFFICNVLILNKSFIFFYSGYFW